jgi:hypothetical protein
MRIGPFLLGVITTASLVASLYFFKFWHRTRDLLFLCFSVAFLIEAANRTSILFLRNPSEGSPWTYAVRLVAFLIILAGILGKNYGRSR